MEVTDNKRITWQSITENGELQNLNTLSVKLESDVTPGMFNNLKIGWKIATKNSTLKMQRASAWETLCKTT